MKTKIYIKVLWLLFIPVLYFIITAGINGNESILITSKSITDNPPAKDFINLIFTDTYFGRTNPNDTRAIENNIKNFKDSLHFNAIHVYGYDNSGGGFNDSINSYSVYVSGLMDTVKNNGLKGYYGRNKIERLCYGQRLEYEAEGGNNGFSYQTINGSIKTDSGRTVVHGCLTQQNCPEADATPRYLCQNIYENLQHGDLIDFTQLDDSTWFIKPVMRIDSNAVDNNPNDSVVRIDVVNYKGRIIKSVKISVKDFSESGNLNYAGNYICRFHIPDSILSIKGMSFDSAAGLNYGMRSDSWNKWKDNCKVDFKVWWYGKVEVWFDKMVVDDYWGDQLFSGEMDGKIKDGATEQNFNSILYQLRYDKNIKYSNFPCMYAE